jgi:hypothetical protein
MITVEILQLSALRSSLQDSSKELPANYQVNYRLTPRLAAISHQSASLFFTAFSTELTTPELDCRFSTNWVASIVFNFLGTDHIENSPFPSLYA